MFILVVVLLQELKVVLFPQIAVFCFDYGFSMMIQVSEKTQRFTALKKGLHTFARTRSNQNKQREPFCYK